MKQSGIIEKIEEDALIENMHSIHLLDVFGKYNIENIGDYKIGDKVSIEYNIDKIGYLITKITKYQPAEPSQTGKDINASVVTKILSQLVSSGKIEDDKGTLITEGKKWLEVIKELRI